MTLNRIFATLFFIAINSANCLAQETVIKEFGAGSYQQILSANANKAFMLVIWSVDCSSCLKDMEIISALHNDRPELQITMLSTDDASALPQIEKILVAHKLTDVPNWVFAGDDAQKLRFEIDPSWYGELPRTYFFNQTHHRTGKSGALRRDDLDTLI